MARHDCAPATGRRRPFGGLLPGGSLAPYLMMAPLIGFCAAFMLVPSLILALRALVGPDGFTLGYLALLTEPVARRAATNSFLLALSSAVTSVIAGGLIALAIELSGRRLLRELVESFSLVAANFAGVPLAFAFVSTLGMMGVLTRLLKGIGIDLYAHGFTLFSLGGLTLVYGYFQVPLMVAMISPTIRAMSRDWHEAAQSLGASGFQYLALVAVPVLSPALLSAFILSFGNAFSGYATAYALTTGNVPLLTTEIANALTGDVVSAPQQGAALSLLMFVIMGLTMLASHLLGRRVNRWLPR